MCFSRKLRLVRMIIKVIKLFNFKQRNRLNIRNHFFSQTYKETYNFWNALPQEAYADSIDTFKKHLSYSYNLRVATVVGTVKNISQ